MEREKVTKGRFGRRRGKNPDLAHICASRVLTMEVLHIPSSLVDVFFYKKLLYKQKVKSLTLLSGREQPRLHSLTCAELATMGEEEKYTLMDKERAVY